jgi:hypothetical protein
LLLRFVSPATSVRGEGDGGALDFSIWKKKGVHF